jgi:hypothetical protein
MKKRMMAALGLTLLATVARAQDTPAADVAVGYSALRVVNGLTAHGGGGSVALNASRWLGAVGDFALYHAGPIGPGVAAGTYTFGPRFSYCHWDKFTPFAQVLVGGVCYANNGFILGAGGGTDIGLNRGGKFALRPRWNILAFARMVPRQIPFAYPSALSSALGKSSQHFFRKTRGGKGIPDRGSIPWEGFPTFPYTLRATRSSILCLRKDQSMRRVTIQALAEVEQPDET